jgi:hypothetical protein
VVLVRKGLRTLRLDESSRTEVSIVVLETQGQALDPDTEYLVGVASWLLARDLRSYQALVWGLPVPCRRLEPIVLKALGLVADDGPLVMTPELALLIEVYRPEGGTQAGEAAVRRPDDLLRVIRETDPERSSGIEKIRRRVVTPPSSLTHAGWSQTRFQRRRRGCGRLN